MFEPNEGPRRAYRHAHCFPLPKSLLEPLFESIQECGYRALDVVSESYTEGIYQAIDPSGGNPRLVRIKVFLGFQHFDRDVRVGVEVRVRKAKAVAKLLMENPHPNILSPLGVAEFGRHRASIFESYGSDLSKLDLSSAEGRRDYISAIAQVANAMAHLHRLGIVQDIVRPSSVLFKVNEAGKIEAALCGFDTECVPNIQKKPDWKNVGGLKDMLEDVKEAEQKSLASGKKRKSNGDTVSNESSNMLVAIDKMIDVLNTSMQLKTEPKGNIDDHEKSVFQSIISNLEKLQSFLPAE